MRKSLVVFGLSAALLVSSCGSSTTSEQSSNTDSASPPGTEAPEEPETSETLPSTTTSTTSTTTTTLAPLPVLTRDDCSETLPEGVFTKDSASYQGSCIHFWASVFQFDSNTGPCQFLGKYADGPRSRWYEFSDAIVSVSGEKEETDFRIAELLYPGLKLTKAPPQRNCDLLAPIVADDLVEVWGLILGVDSYSTVGGGSNSYTVIQVVDIQKYG